MIFLTRKKWSPYVAGAITGLLLCVSVFFTGKYFGASTTFVRSAGLIEKAISPQRVAEMEYFVKTNVGIDWQWMFVIGILFGALIASRISGDYKVTPVPPMWQKQFGPNKPRRWSVAFIGGIILMFGARMAGGCPSGHGLSGLAQMAVSSYISLFCFFLTGVVTSKLLYK